MKSYILKRAWKIYRSLEGGDRISRMSVALKISWEEFKNRTAVRINMIVATKSTDIIKQQTRIITGIDMIKDLYNNSATDTQKALLRYYKDGYFTNNDGYYIDISQPIQAAFNDIKDKIFKIVSNIFASHDTHGIKVNYNKLLYGGVWLEPDISCYSGWIKYKRE